jgi:GNAT superfamily N-acetyltransferase
MVKLILKNDYKIKELTLKKQKTLKILNQKCTDYYLLHDGVLPSKKEVLEIFNALPPGKNYKDKHVLGVYKCRNELIGIIEIIKNLPVNGEWMIGLLVIEPEERDNGLGKLIHEALSQWAITLGAKSFRIGVIEENYKGKRFWSNLGYIKVNEETMAFTKKTHIVNVMTYQLAG